MQLIDWLYRILENKEMYVGMYVYDVAREI